MKMDDATRKERPQRTKEPWRKEGGGDDAGPTRPDIEEPSRKRLLRRMRQVDKDQARRYRQRTGE